jgi:hypothetical protein
MVKENNQPDTQTGKEHQVFFKADEQFIAPSHYYCQQSA